MKAAELSELDSSLRKLYRLMGPVGVGVVHLTGPRLKQLHISQHLLLIKLNSKSIRVPVDFIERQPIHVDSTVNAFLYTSCCGIRCINRSFDYLFLHDAYFWERVDQQALTRERSMVA